MAGGISIAGSVMAAILLPSRPQTRDERKLASPEPDALDAVPAHTETQWEPELDGA